MEVITGHSLNRAADAAVQLWALASAQYPKQHRLNIDVATTSILEVVRALALNARRALEVLPTNERFPQFFRVNQILGSSPHAQSLRQYMSELTTDTFCAARDYHFSSGS